MRRVFRQDNVFIVRNSWGADWGDNGYCYMPYDYVMNPDLNLGDCWMIQQLDNFDVDQSLWASDEESFLPTLDTELAQMSDEETNRSTTRWEEYRSRRGSR